MAANVSDAVCRGICPAFRLVCLLCVSSLKPDVCSFIPIISASLVTCTRAGLDSNSLLCVVLTGEDNCQPRDCTWTPTDVYRYDMMMNVSLSSKLSASLRQTGTYSAAFSPGWLAGFAGLWFAGSPSLLLDANSYILRAVLCALKHLPAATFAFP